MLGFAAISELAISEVPDVAGIQSAVLNAAGAGAFAAVGASMATAAFSMSGAGALAAVGLTVHASSFAAAGAGALSGVTAAKAAAAFSAAGRGSFDSIVASVVPRPARGNTLLTTSYIVDMDIPRPPGDAKPSKSGGKMRDKKGRKIYWD